MFETKITNQKGISEPGENFLLIRQGRKLWSEQLLIIKHLGSLLLRPLKLIDEIKYLHLKRLSPQEISNKVTQHLIAFLKRHEVEKVLDPTLKDSFELELDLEKGAKIEIHKPERHNYFTLVFKVADSIKVDQYTFLIPISKDWTHPIAFAKRDIFSPFGNVSFPEKMLLSKADNALTILYIRDFLKINLNYKTARISKYRCTPDLKLI